MIASAYAQNAPVAAQNPVMSFVPFVLVFVVFYFLMIRPQKKRSEQEKVFLGGLKRGDEIYTKAGILGTIVGLTDKVVELEVSRGVKLKVLRSQVADMSSKLSVVADGERPKR